MIALSGTIGDVIRFLEGKEAERVRVNIEFFQVSGRAAPQPAPADSAAHGGTALLLDADQVAERLGLTDRKHPGEAVKYLHRTRQLPGVMVSGRLRWKPQDVEEFVRTADK